jgi:hypothetical protein
MKRHYLVEDQYVRFTGKNTHYDQFNRVAVAWNGGRHVTGGKIDPNPFPYTYRCATIMDAHGGSAEDQASCIEIAVGDVVYFKAIDGQRLEGEWLVVEPSWSNGGIKFARIMLEEAQR